MIQIHTFFPNSSRFVVTQNLNAENAFVQLLSSSEDSVLSNGLYAVSSLLRNSEGLRTLFYANGAHLFTFCVVNFVPKVA